jgi:hypothetical protein
MHLVVHRSAKISVTHLRKGLMEVTITSGMSKEALHAAAAAAAKTPTKTPAASTDDLARPAAERTDDDDDDDALPVSPLAKGPVQRFAAKGSGFALANRSLSNCNVLLLEGEAPQLRPTQAATPTPTPTSSSAASSRPPTGLSKLSLAEPAPPRATPPPPLGSGPQSVSPCSASLTADLCHSVERARHGLRTGQAPSLAPCGTGGTYFLCDANGEKVTTPPDLLGPNPLAQRVASRRHRDVESPERAFDKLSRVKCDQASVRNAPGAGGGVQAGGRGTAGGQQPARAERAQRHGRGAAQGHARGRGVLLRATGVQRCKSSES